MVELAGEYEFAAPQELVWEMILNPEILSMTIAGCERLERVDESTLHGRLNLRVGPVQGIFQGKVESTDVHAPSSLHMIVSGSGPAGVVRGEGNIMLEAMPTTTRLRYDGAVQVSGRIASVGQRVMDSSAKSIVKQSLQNLEKQIQARMEPELQPVLGVETVIAPSVSTLPGAPGQAEFVFNVAKDVLRDLVPDTGLRRVLIVVGVAVVVIGFIQGFANLVARRVVKILREEKR
jgi:carbon monoxide dehydrogenase subunit G